MTESGPPPLRTVLIQILGDGEAGRGASIDGVIQALKRRTGDISTRGEEVEISDDRVICRYRAERAGGFSVLTSTITFSSRMSETPVGDLSSYDLSGSVSSSTGLRLLSTFTVSIFPLGGEKEGETLLKQYSDPPSRRRRGIGKVGRCLVSLSEAGAGDEPSFDRSCFIMPLNRTGRSIDDGVEWIVEGTRRLALHAAEVSDQYSRSKGVFSVVESGEEEISVKIEEFLWKLMQPEPVDLKTLESWLSYVMERESTTSAILSAIRIGHAEAREALSKAESVLGEWTEGRVGEHPTNLEQERASHRGVMWPFEKAIVRAEGLENRLMAVMEEVRTYLSLQQQKNSIEEQKASRDQLERLVNLQETLHKLEILIVAFYILEMARLVLDAVAHEYVNMLSAALIPVALLASILISRALHKLH
jgi:hypothetical protein